MVSLDRRQQVILIWCAVAVVITAFEGSVLVIALPAVATEFNANTPALSDLGSVLAVGTLGALPLSTLAEPPCTILMPMSPLNVSPSIAASAPETSMPPENVFSRCRPRTSFTNTSLEKTSTSSDTSAGTSMIVEEAPREHRGAAVSVLALLSGVGIFIVVVAYPLIAPHWRWLYYAGGAGLLVAPLIWWLLPESKTWQAVRVTGSALRLLMERPWRRRVAILATMTGLLAVLLEPAGLLYTVYASFILHWSTLAISILIVVSGIVGAVSYLAGGYLTDRFGRRGPAIALTVVTAAATSLSFATSTPVFGAWSGELFPTRARATAEATIAVVAAVGSIAGLQAVAKLAATTGFGGAIELGGVVALAGALLLFLLPETKQQPLPE